MQRRSCVAIAVSVIALLLSVSAYAQQAKTSKPKPRQSVQVPALGKEQLLAPEELVKILQSPGTKPLILNIGPWMLYSQARIPGAEFIGPGMEPQSIQALKKRVNGLPKTTSMVLYCGCCPWIHCPNVEPAYQALRSLGFTKVKVLYIATNLGVDWVYKGYPTTR